METIEYKCKICNKQYKTYQTLWKHNKKFHHQNVVVCSSNEVVSDVVCGTLTIKKNNCTYCNKIFNDRSNKYKHQKICKFKEQYNDKIKLELLKEENKKLELEIKLKKINKITNNTTNNITNNNNETINNNNNGTINNVFVKYNNISYDALTKKEILCILSKHDNALEESIKKIHFNENIPEYNNVFITNLKDQYGHAFDGKQFSTINKAELLNDIIDTHINEIYFSKDKYNVKQITKDKINNLENKINKNMLKFTDENNKVYKNYKDYKMEIIKLLIYNLCDKDKFDEIKKLDNIHEKEDFQDDSEI
jgi:outer membrane protein OmpA-like peptidoglycan-associated protein